MTAPDWYYRQLEQQAAHLEGMRTVYSDLASRYLVRAVRWRASGDESQAAVLEELARELTNRMEGVNPDLAAEYLRRRGVVPPREVAR